ncbi:heparinase [Terrihabitans soli]|uniref:Heparinase n=1 Tax=Terrihabitans soli TaxID=708113 RepID=A0A6S6QEG2_9HYPH|nr:heparinase II/III family protein [Terrihabitans soli]BCJ89503.1 heparinase [Terrihabitans soli]
MADAMADRAHTRTQLTLLVLTEAAARLSPRRLMRFGLPFSVPDRLIAIPRPVIDGDAIAGAALYGGTFSFAGASREAAGKSIFEIAAPNSDWARELHGFSWLADLAAADTVLARAYARSLIAEWAAFGRGKKEAREAEVAARRVINFLTYANFLIDDADAVFRRRFLRGLARQTSRLRREIGRLPSGMPRLLTAIALTEAGLCLPDSSGHLACGSNYLNDDLGALILPDGGPATRNPSDVLTLALDLLPLTDCFTERGLAPPPALNTALDRMLPMLRFFRHTDGTLALFNGMGATRTDLLAAAIALDETRGQPVQNASFSGYQRMEAGDAVLIADTGLPPPLALSRDAHAGTLSFELTAGDARLVVNCGVPRDGHAGRRMAARKTAAHSTASVGGASSARFVSNRFLRKILGPLLRDGPTRVEVFREDRHGAGLIRASHNGYQARFGLVHERSLQLDPKGTRLDGMDVLRPMRRKTHADITLAFHLHPDVRASLVDEGEGVLLSLPDGEIWLFAAEGHKADLEESIFFAGPSGPRRTEQILLKLGARAGARVNWSFIRAGREAGQ